MTYEQCPRAAGRYTFELAVAAACELGNAKFGVYIRIGNAGVWNMAPKSARLVTWQNQKLR